MLLRYVRCWLRLWPHTEMLNKQTGRAACALQVASSALHTRTAGCAGPASLRTLHHSAAELQPRRGQDRHVQPHTRGVQPHRVPAGLVAAARQCTVLLLLYGTRDYRSGALGAELCAPAGPRRCGWCRAAAPHVHACQTHIPAHVHGHTCVMRSNSQDLCQSTG